MDGQKELPIFSAPATLQCDAGPLVCWFTQPPGVVFQLTQTARMTVAMASWAAGDAFAALRARFAGSRSFYYVMDIRAMTARDAGVRETFMELARHFGPQLTAAVIIPPRRANPMYLSALQTANALIAPFGAKLEVTSDLRKVLERYRLTPAAA